MSSHVQDPPRAKARTVDSPGGRGSEITSGLELDLCHIDRSLNRAALGWSRQPWHRCALHGPWLRQKRWDAWGICSPSHFAMIGVMNLDYVNLAAVYVYDRQTNQLHAHSARHLLGRGCQHADTVAGVCAFDHPDVQVRIESTDRQATIRVRCRQGRAAAIDLEATAQRPEGHESLNLVIPWDDRHYHFTSKQSCLPTAGRLTVGGQTHELDSRDATAWLDFARGVWPYASGWNWAMCTSSERGRLLGFNLGAGWTDSAGVTENALYVDGRLSKIDDPVSFTFDRQNVLKPWRIETKASDRVRLEFHPCARRRESMQMLLVSGSLDQVLGHFSGQIVTDAGEAIAIDRLFGVVEDHRARW